MEFKKLLNELNALNLPIEKYAITSSGPLGVRGIRKSKDLDIIVTKELWSELASKYNHSNNSSLKIGNIEFFCEKLFSNSVGPSINQQIMESEIIEGYPFVKLETIKYFKQISTREKDKLDLKLIQEYEDKNKKH